MGVQSVRTFWYSTHEHDQHTTTGINSGGPSDNLRRHEFPILGPTRITEKIMYVDGAPFICVARATNIWKLLVSQTRQPDKPKEYLRERWTLQFPHR